MRARLIWFFDCRGTMVSTFAYTRIAARIELRDLLKCDHKELKEIPTPLEVGRTAWELEQVRL